MNVPAVVGRLRASPPGQFGQKFMDDRALTLASLVAWGMLNTFLPLLLGVLALLGILLGDSPAAATAEAMLLAALPAWASELVSESFAAIQQAAGVAGLVSLGATLHGEWVSPHDLDPGGDGHPLANFAVSPNGAVLARASRHESVVRLWSLPDGRALGLLEGSTRCAGAPVPTT